MSYNDYKLTEKEELVYIEFKNYAMEKYSDVRKQFWDDWFQLKFCRARQYKIVDVKKMFDNYVKFFKKYNLDNIIEIHHSNKEWYDLFWGNISKHYVISKDNQPVSFEFRKYFNETELIKIPDKIFTELNLKLFEDEIKVMFPLLSKKAGKRIDKINLVFDLKDAALSQYFNSQVQDRFYAFTKMLQDYYPENLGKIQILNPPFIFYGLFTLLKPFLANSTKEKIELLRGKDINKRLHNWIDIDLLPEQYGGNLKINHHQSYNHFSHYIELCNNKGTYLLEDGFYNLDEGIYPPDDPLERAKTIDPDYKPKEKINLSDESYNFETEEDISPIQIPRSKVLKCGLELN